MRRLVSWIDSKGLSKTAKHKGLGYWCFWLLIFLAGWLVMILLYYAVAAGRYWLLELLRNAS